MQPTLQESMFFFIQASVLSIVIVFLSLIQYKRSGRDISDEEMRKKAGLRMLGFRFLAGFIMGWFDHILMIWGGFHDYFWPIAYWYVTSVYTTFMLLIPPYLDKKQRKWFIPLWLIATIAFSSITETSFRLFVLCGYLCYPVGWTVLTTVIFYIDVHCLGTFIATLHWDPRLGVISSNTKKISSEDGII